MSDSFETPQMKRMSQFIQGRQAEAAVVWQDPLMQDLIAQLCMERGLQEMTGNARPFTLDDILIYICFAYVAGQERMRKAGALQKMLGVDVHTLDRAICPGCGEVIECLSIHSKTLCPSCMYGQGDDEQINTIRAFLWSDDQCNHVRPGAIMRALRGLGLLVVPEDE